MRSLTPTHGAIVRRYFYSGWAFLVPYLFIYLLYAWKNWPVNPAAAQRLFTAIDGAAPPLLHVFWMLHAVHLILAGIGIYLWWKEREQQQATRHKEDSSLTAAKCPRSSLDHCAWAEETVPWLCLAFIFYIPGVYLEWPSDPWEHLRRINEWSQHTYVEAHSAWHKFSYFLAYSVLVGDAVSPEQLQLNIYYTAACLLLCWQYYRLAKSTNLNKPASLVFVLTQALIFGNNIFSFYRYYGISSSIYAQIGAVAAIRQTLSFLQGPYSKLRFSCVMCFILSFTALNHQQGIGIAALGCGAAAVWKIANWRPVLLLWLLGLGTLISCGTVLGMRNSQEIDLIKTQGFLNQWYGFNLFSFSSPAADRALQIMGTFGILNTLAGVILLRSNNPAAWLTIFPLIALSLPCIALPFSHQLIKHGESTGTIISFQRMLFALPTGLAIAHLASEFRRRLSLPILTTILVLATMLMLTALPTPKPNYQRFWHTIARIPSDLQMSHLAQALQTAKLNRTTQETVTTFPDGQVLRALGEDRIYYSARTINEPLVYSAQTVISTIAEIDNPGSPFYHHSLTTTEPLAVYTPASYAGLLSGHWRPQHASIDNVGKRQIKQAILSKGWAKEELTHTTLYLFR